MRYVITALLCITSALAGAVGAVHLLRPAPYKPLDPHLICAERHAPNEAAIAACRASFAIGAKADAIRTQAVEAYKARAGL